jgi:hypothetical protein
MPSCATTIPVHQCDYVPSKIRGALDVQIATLGARFERGMEESVCRAGGNDDPPLRCAERLSRGCSHVVGERVGKSRK